MDDPCWAEVEIRVRHRLLKAGCEAPTINSPRPLLVSEPFVGLAGTHDVMQEWQIPYEPINVYDIQSGLREILCVKFGRDISDRCELGLIDGNMLNVPLQLLSGGDGLVAGPPCPPWSSIGPKLGIDDMRVQPFERLLAWLTQLYVMGLLFVIIENVQQIFQRDAEGRNYGSTVIDFLNENLPAFRWRVVSLNCAPHLLPHRRLRVFFVGVRRDCLRTEEVPKPLSLEHIPQVPLAELLSGNEPNVDFESLTRMRQQKLRQYETYLEKN